MVQTPGLVRANRPLQTQTLHLLLEKRLEAFRALVRAAAPRVTLWTLVDADENMVRERGHRLRRPKPGSRAQGTWTWFNAPAQLPELGRPREAEKGTMRISCNKLVHAMGLTVPFFYRHVSGKPRMVRRMTEEALSPPTRNSSSVHWGTRLSSPHDSRTLSVRESCADRCGSSAPVGFDWPYGRLKASPERSPPQMRRSRSPQGGLFTLCE